MYRDIGLSWAESAGAISALNAASNAMSAVSTDISATSSICQLSDVASRLSDVIDLSSMTDLVEEYSSLSNFVDDSSANTDLVGTFASAIEDNAAVSDMSGLIGTAASALETSLAFSDKGNLIDEMQSVINAEEDYSNKFEQINETKSLIDATADISPVRNFFSGFATAVSGVFAGASFMTETFELLSNACQAISEVINQLVETFADSIQSTFSRLEEYVKNLAEVFRQNCRRVKYAFQNQLLTVAYRHLAFLPIGNPQRITMRNTIFRRKKVIFHRKQGGKSEPDSICCVKYIAVVD